MSSAVFIGFTKEPRTVVRGSSLFILLSLTCRAPQAWSNARSGPRRRKLHIPRFSASGKARSFRCSSFPHETRFAGSAGTPSLD